MTFIAPRIQVMEEPFDSWLFTWNLVELKYIFIDYNLTSQHSVYLSSPQFNRLINDSRIPKQYIPRIIAACKQNTNINDDSYYDHIQTIKDTKDIKTASYEQLILQQIDIELRLLNNIEAHFLNQKTSDLRYPSPHKKLIETKIKTEFNTLNEMMQTKKKLVLSEFHQIDKNYMNELAKNVYFPIFSYVHEWRAYFEKQLNLYQNVIINKTGNQKQIYLVKMQHNLRKIKFIEEKQWQIAQKKMNKIIKKNCKYNNSMYCDFIINNHSKLNIKANIDNIGLVMNMNKNNNNNNINSDVFITDNNNMIDAIDTPSNKPSSSGYVESDSQHSSHNDDEKKEEEEEEEKEIFLFVHPSWSSEHKGNRISIHPPHCILRHIGREKWMKNGGIKYKIWSCCKEKVGKTLGCSRPCGNLKKGCKWKWNCCRKYGVGSPGCYKMCHFCKQNVSQPGCCKITPLHNGQNNKKSNDDHNGTLEQLKELYLY